MTPHANGYSGDRLIRRHGRSLARSAVIGSIALAVALIPAGPASASVHEIVGQWCSGHGPLEPPGINGGSAADNFAQPVNSNGFVQGTVPFTGPAGPGLLVNFNFDHPAAKVVGTGVFVVIGPTPAGPLYLQLVAPDPRFPAFQHCPRLVTG
jgi:hypothetical protein